MVEYIGIFLQLESELKGLGVTWKVNNELFPLDFFMYMS